MIGQAISHYKILEKLGGGGMGVVYKTEDTKLKRTVALKFLPPELTRDPEAKARFIHEAQAASALDHPNICDIHEIGETEDGQMFIAMACYEGDTLKMRIEKGRLGIEEAIEITTQVAQGLQKAHEKGIVHRDIKPANIIITNDGVSKILDFGLAKLAGQAKLTKTGSTVGAAAYMSPEQAQDVDHRTDIWSLGVVMYEMLTGKLPFRGEHEAALLYSIVHEEPLAISGFRTDIPGNLASVIFKTLQKDPRQRYQAARELVSDLKAVMAPGIQLPKQEKSIVVLPFENLSPDPDQEYFSDGLTEEVISDLSAVRSLRVISRSSAMTFKGTKKKIPEIARDVNVQYVLEGSVRKAGNSLRITAQLIDAQNDTHLLAEKYSGTLDDVFDIQEKVSHAIVNALKLKLAPEEERKMAERPIGDLRAYECYLRAMHEIWHWRGETLTHALQYLQEALEMVGDNVLLYAGMAEALTLVDQLSGPIPTILRTRSTFIQIEATIMRTSQTTAGGFGIVVSLLVLLLWGCSSSKPGIWRSDAPVPRPKSYVCYHVSSPLSIDGKLDEADWAGVPWTDNFTDIEGDRRPAPRYRTRAKMLWDDECFLIGAEVSEPHIWAKLVKRDTVIYYDNDFEVFIDPNGDNHEYYEFEMNALNTVWDLFLPKPYRDQGRAVDSWNIDGLKTAVNIKGTLNDPRDIDSCWTVEVAMPWKSLAMYAHKQIPPAEEDQWRVNFSRVEWTMTVEDGAYVKVKGLPEDNWVWSPQWVVDMHRPEMWGYVQFTRKSAGTVTIVPDASWDARVALMRIYYAQRALFEKHKRWAGTRQELGNYPVAAPAGITPPVIQLNDTGYVCTVRLTKLDGHEQRWHISQDSRIWTD
jgi:serine/threonine protein kinase